MYSKPILVIAASFALMSVLSGVARAGESSAQLAVSLTIVKSCEVVSEPSVRAVQVSSHGCESAAFRLQDESGAVLTTEVVRGRTVAEPDSASKRLVVYW